MENIQNEILTLNENDIPNTESSKNNFLKKVTFNTASAKDYATNEAFKTLRTNIFFCGNDIKIILVTSCRENEGKSTISTELAKSLAESGKKSLLIDADMRKSIMLKKRKKTSSDVSGLSEILSGMCSLNDAIYNTQLENFDVIFSGPFPPNPVELIGFGNFERLLNILKERYDYIIIDSPPLGQVVDAAVIASYCDAAIMVISARKTSRKEALDVKNQLEKSNCWLLGAVLNETERRGVYSIKKYYGKYNYR